MFLFFFWFKGNYLVSVFNFSAFSSRSSNTGSGSSLLCPFTSPFSTKNCLWYTRKLLAQKRIHKAHEEMRVCLECNWDLVTKFRKWLEPNSLSKKVHSISHFTNLVQSLERSHWLASYCLEDFILFCPLNSDRLKKLLNLMVLYSPSKYHIK